MKIHNLHRWNVSPKEAVQIQLELQKKLKVTSLRQEPYLIAGCDASFQGKKAIGTVVVMTYRDLTIVEEARKEIPLTYPYIPTLLTFREAPVLIKCLRSLKIVPDVILFDGQGIAHPRRMGLAAHMGVLLRKPTIGCAKSRLTGRFSEPEKTRGSFSYMKDDNSIIGAALRTRDNVNPVYVSIGHKITLEDSIGIILSCVRKYRLPEPIRAAHSLASSGLKTGS
ncbi:MAG: endonuclease V [Candidatus Aureabacteria bacterium]|nr:endonuclease V [Candidatus Auribacterota bacterium]